MNTVPVTFSLPKTTRARLNKYIPARNRSKFVSKIIDEKLTGKKFASTSNPWQNLLEFAQRHPAPKDAYRKWLSTRHDGLA